MARYAEYEDIELAVDEDTLTRLTDNQGVGEPDQTVVEQFLDAAADQINGKVGMKYTLPLDEVPSVLKSWNIDICVYCLFGYRNGTAGEVWEQRYHDAVSGLNAVAMGKMTLGATDPQGSGNRRKVRYSTKDRLFSRDIGGY